ncbi:VIT1/CCC1 transporter family protein [Corynebacterium pilosum]|uniref:Fe 2+/Mn2+ transporter pcl1 n=1 Tax=Corynebacterium pilosum TaxID=35756 RepID=A0A376CJW7_9CORY|nr:VIT1/CCC1 transporter family protein [Corynebacterium pilosum]STC68562.1 Fe 2+/Mn2+ transporter pcl1 [Corynebacterium pilosum]
MTEPTKAQIKRWRRYLANERAEAAVYRELAHKREGEEREILLRVADAESRHEQYWRDKLGDYVGMPQQPDLSTRFMAFLARHFGSVFALALMQSAEQRSPYLDDVDASDQIAADEAMHAEVVRALAQKGRERMSGNFRAAVFGANDGLVSNVALVIGVMGSGVSSNFILLTGISGLLAGALSMAAGEYVSVKSQNELLEASTPDPTAREMLPSLDVKENELALVYRARGYSPEEAEQRAADHYIAAVQGTQFEAFDDDSQHGAGGAWTAAASSFVFFSVGAFVPLVPFIFGASPTVGAVVALVLVSLALLFTGGVTGVLSGKPPLSRAIRQLLIGLGAAAVTYVLGVAFGAVLT